jgi:type I restriction enzyme R subunit
MAAQECIPTNAIKDKFAADYQVLNRAWNAVSPDPILNPLQPDYVWLTKVFESVKPTDGGGGLIWAALGCKDNGNCELQYGALVKCMMMRKFSPWTLN